MLESLLLKNFQAHRNLEIRFSPTVTSIVGPSDVGKTAIIRALRWAFLNEALGGIQRHNTKKTIARLVIDGHTINRKRVGGTNSYSYDGKSYTAIKRDVPSSIRSLLRVGRVSFQGQHDSPYWLSDTGGSVSRELNAIVDLGIIDRTLGNIASQSRDAGSDLKAAERRFETAKQEAEELKWVEECQAEYRDLESAANTLGEVSRRAADLTASLAKATAAQTALYGGKDRLAAAQILLLAAKVAAKASQAKKELANTLGKATAAASAAALQVPEPHTLGFALQHREQLEALITKLEAQESKICQVQKRLHTSSKQLERQMGKRCPVCGKMMT